MLNITSSVCNGYKSHAESSSKGPANLGGGSSMPSLTPFMDDRINICSKVDEPRRMLACLDAFMSWCILKFKPKKPRNLSIRKGKIEEAVLFAMSEQQSLSSQPRIGEKPRKMERLLEERHQNLSRNSRV
ncbi:reverse transcriptase [Elysia marginata]|uniref:Reverse transcriptase n=1 Tax=Elysia marginata TaxID=1093978 RepID=A0AAV4EY46_9GAST|nr:reverse transcriptase [Elysia marginata]